MGLFSKPTAEDLMSTFNKIDDVQKDAFLKMLEERTKPAEEAAEPETAKTETDAVAEPTASEEDTEKPTSETGAENPVSEANTENAEVTNPPKESYEEMYARLKADSEKAIADLRSEYDKRFEELSKKEETAKVETKPFGLTEQAKEVGSDSATKMTSQEWLNKHFR